MKKFILALIFTPWLVLAQDGQGIRFETELNWQQVLAKAAAENKHVFVDCYATWCGPCKAMEKDVYPQEKVGAFFNDKFVSVKIQMDVTPQDSAQVKGWHGTAKELQETYKLKGYPSYLFFSPKGRIVHRAIGQMGPETLIRTGGAALNPAEQVYTLLENYRQGQKDYPSLIDAARAAKLVGDQPLAMQIAEDYKKNYWDRLSDAEAFTRKNVVLMGDFPSLINKEGSQGRFFKFLYQHQAKADELFGRQGVADHFVRAIITDEEVTRKLWKDDKPISRTPDWQGMTAAIKQKFNDDYARSIVSSSKVNFYGRLKDWKSYVEAVEEKMQLTPPGSKGTAFGGSWGDTWALNGYAWSLFLGCTDKFILDRALAWSELSIKLEGPEPNVQYWDTKASLLYKLGRVEDAIALEQSAHDRVLAKSGPDHGLVKEYARAIAAMKQGEPIYAEQGAVWDDNTLPKKAKAL